MEGLFVFAPSSGVAPRPYVAAGRHARRLRHGFPLRCTFIQIISDWSSTLKKIAYYR
jgi:hypothetical protein